MTVYVYAIDGRNGILGWDNTLSLSQGGKKLGHMQKRVSARVGPAGGVPDAEGRQKRKRGASSRACLKSERGDGFLMPAIAAIGRRARDRNNARRRTLLDTQ